MLLYNSLNFVLFIGIASVVFYLLPRQRPWRLVMLLAASLLFGWIFGGMVSLLILIGLSLATYLLALQLDPAKPAPYRKRIFFLAMLINIGSLALFKYLPFAQYYVPPTIFLETVKNLVGRATDWVLPVGISYYTFCNLSYLIDVYRKTQKPERNLAHYGLYILFFPKLLAGPIERARSFIPQLLLLDRPGDENISEGLKLITWGLFKKLVIADRLAVYVSEIYDNPAGSGALNTILATYLFAFQIYSDFSGYSDIALGIGKLLGISLTNNFKQPYLAPSIGEFWNGWHISLTTWLRDYIFFPLRRAMLRKNRTGWQGWNFLIPPLTTMLISGIWHGNTWNFVLWGALHGFYFVIDQWVDNIARRFGWSGKIFTALRIFLTFHLTCLAWILFRAKNLPDALILLQNIASFRFSLSGNALYISLSELAMLAGIIALLIFSDVAQKYFNFSERFKKLPGIVRWTVYYLGVMAVLTLAFYTETPQTFFYFRF